MLIVALDESQPSRICRGLEKYFATFPSHPVGVLSPCTSAGIRQRIDGKIGSRKLLLRRLEDAGARFAFIGDMMSGSVLDENWFHAAPAVVAGSGDQDVIDRIAGHPALAGLYQLDVLIRSVAFGDQLVLTEISEDADRMGEWLAGHVLARLQYVIHDCNHDAALKPRCDDEADVLCIDPGHRDFPVLLKQLGVPEIRFRLFADKGKVCFAVVVQKQATGSAPLFPVLYWGGCLREAITSRRTKFESQRVNSKYVA